MNVEQLLRDLNREHWSPRLQRVYFAENTAVYLAGRDAQSTLSADGRKWHKPIMSHVVDGVYTPGSDIDDTELKAEDESLEVDTFRYGSAYIDRISAKQNFYSAVNFAANSMQKTLNNRIEQKFLSEVDNAAHTIAAGIADTTNIVDVFGKAHTNLDSADVPMVDRVAVVGPHTIEILRKVKADRETQLGDTVLENGIIGPWKGWTVVQNNNLPYSAELKIATQPTNDDTVTIAGVKFTFKTTLGTDAGNVLIGANAAAARANLKAAIEGGSGAGTTYIAPKANDLFTLLKRGITITSDKSMVIKGFGDIVVSETLTAAADVFSKQEQKAWFGMRGATDLVVQLPPSPEFTPVEKRFGVRAKALAGYGAKTFADGAMALNKVTFDASQWV